MTSTTGSKTLLIVLQLISICLDVNSDLIVKPKDAEAVVGSATFFNCSTNLTSAKIHWFHYAVGDAKDGSIVYGYDQFYSTYQGRFQMEKNTATGAYNLIISSVTVADAGRYECQDDIGRGDKDSAQLTVLDESPICQSNMKPTGFIGPNIGGFEPEEMHLTCAVQYHGNQPPIMQWKKVGSDNPIAEGVTHNISSNRAIHYLKMEVNAHMDGSSYHCETMRSATSQYGCTSDVVKIAGFNRTYVIIICVLVGLGVVIMSAIAGFGVGRIQRDHKMRQKDSTEHPQHLSTSKESEEIALIEPQDKVTIEKLETENKRLLAKVNELEQLIYSSDNKINKTEANLVHTIVTRAADEMDTPITGMTILENNLFIVKINCPVVEVYDSKTFSFERLIENLQFKNPMDIASSKEDKFLYVINRENSESTSNILKFKITGEGGKIWPTENDVGRLSTYESNLIVCFCTKRIIIEYTPEGETLNTVRLSPANGFDKIWHAVKLTGTHLAVSHSKVDGQRVCVVDINGSVLAAFEELPYFLCKTYLPICLVGHLKESVLVADALYKRVLHLSPKELHFEGVLIESDEDQMPVRLCLNETKDRIFVGVNSGDYSKSETRKRGRILIYNIRK